MFKICIISLLAFVILGFVPVMASNIAIAPIAFGYKCSWFAIKTNDTQKVIEFLNIKDVKESDWSNGIKAVYQVYGKVYITQPIDGWVLVIGNSIPNAGDLRYPDKITPVLMKLSLEFPEVQYFSTHRAVEYHAWAKAINGHIIRAYAYIGEQGETIWNKGGPTKEETELSFSFFNEKAPEANTNAYWERKDLRYPGEEDVIRLAKKWINDKVFQINIISEKNGIIGTLSD
ncbi:conserved exported hypothetical protein [uncultured Sporomusa sp.]|uniref:Uncharacterized protein n=1 Tax=uncultured Sporomusa sp. TaxID=307249 RepID=A0A212LUE0_9FIRM|nr:hypothetical protein [uncultured Sporomusa sp.]SCM81009.1 conserved exported hypothetical protein [uncultured Sporomusa sp.]